MKKLFDLSFGLLLALVLLFPMLFIGLIIRLTSRGSAIYWSRRVGKENIEFFMPKFRTMLLKTPQVATHLLMDVDKYYSPVGSFLRRSSLDELPQLLSIIKGDMSFVGPRPALFNQHDLKKLRSEDNIDILRPGVTGWAQVNGRDDLSIEQKVKFDKEYLKNASFKFDLYIIWLTLKKVLRSDGISH